MKKILLLIVVLVCGFLIFTFLKNKALETPTPLNPEENRQEKPFPVLRSISRGQVGMFKNGDPIPTDDLLLKSGYSATETTYYPEGMAQKAYIISENAEQVLILKLSYQNKINDINVLSPKFMTAEGIVVGSTISDFIKAYPNYILWYSAEEGEHFVLNITKDENSPQFFLDRSDLVDPKENFFKKEITVSDFKADAQIREIRVYGF
jgi:hypothetical protein